MKLPTELAARWARQWENPDLREARLLDEPGAWPASLPVGRPTAAEVGERWQTTAAGLRAWREVRHGTVRWESATYRATGAPIEVPVAWELGDAADWVAASGDRRVRSEYESLRALLGETDPLFHRVLVRERSLWKSKPLDEVLRAAQLVLLLEPGCAAGQPLRSLSRRGIDSKFFERHRGLVQRLLDLRHDGEPSRQGLETFLDAARGDEHWLLLADLGGDFAGDPALPFPRLRLRSADLAARLEARALLVVENERCLHLIPNELPGVIAVLGTGDNLSWLASPRLRETRIAYWGDLDTWGLTLLARARRHAPHLVPLLMTREIFDAHADAAVTEATPASEEPPAGLTEKETAFYRHLRSLACGRLEQEFLASQIVHEAVRRWCL